MNNFSNSTQIKLTESIDAIVGRNYDDYELAVASSTFHFSQPSDDSIATTVLHIRLANHE